MSLENKLEQATGAVKKVLVKLLETARQNLKELLKKQLLRQKTL